MGYDRQKVIQLARKEAGYLEKASNSQLDSKTANAGSGNYTKYSRDLAQVSYFNGRKQGVPWCAVFVAWCFFRAYGKEAALELLCQPAVASCNAGAGCRSARNYFSQKGRLHMENPRPGDVIFFYSADKSQIAHTGLIWKADADRVWTVEGNTSGQEGIEGNGGGVWEKSYPLSCDRIAGFGRPDYGDSPEEGAQAESLSGGCREYIVRKGDSLWEIAKRLLGRGSGYRQIQQLNGLSGILIRPGQKLKIPMG